MAYQDPARRFSVLPDTAGPFINGYEHEAPTEAWEQPNPYPEPWTRDSRWEDRVTRASRTLWVALLAIAAFLFGLFIFRAFG